MRQLLVVAANEFRTGLRNRWIFGVVVMFAALSLLLTWLGSAPVGSVKGSGLSVVVSSLASLSVYVVPLVALMISHDAIVGEAERGTLLLLLTYPVFRWQLLGGKLIAHLAILSCALAAGFGAAGIVMALGPGVEAEDLYALLRLIGSSIVLGAAFIALGYVTSIKSRERATAIGVAVGLWLVLVVLYDLALVGLLLADTNQSIGQSALAVAMAANPADAFRVFNLAQLGGSAGLAGFTESAAGITPNVMLLSVMAWAVLGLALSYAMFERYEP